VASSCSTAFQALLGARVGLLLQRLLLDLEPDLLAIERVDLVGLGLGLHLEARRRLVDQIDRLVREKAVGDIAVRQGRGRHQRVVHDADAVMGLVSVLETAQDRDRVLDARLADKHRLEAAGERGVLLDMLLVFVERGRADAVQLAAGERGLEQVRGVHRAIGLAGTDQRVHLVDEQDDAALRGGHFLQHRLEALLELAAVFCAGDQGAEVEREDLLVLEALRHIPVHDPLRKPLDNRGLAHAGLADQNRVVLGAAGQHLDGAADLLVAPDHRIDLLLARRLGEVAGIFLERLVGAFGRGAVGGAALAQGLDGGIEILRSDADAPENLAGLAVLGERDRQQEPLDRDIAVAGLFGDLLGPVEQARGGRREMELAGAAPGDLRNRGERLLDGGQRLARASAGAVNQPGSEPLRIVEEHLEDVLGSELLMAFALRQRLGGLNETTGAVGILFDLHVLPFPQPVRSARMARGDIFMGLTCSNIPLRRMRMRCGGSAAPAEEV
jgi:hypothetical protein